LVVTFDDGYENFATQAMPILRRVGFTATVFLVGNQIGGTNEWDHRGGDVVEPLLSAQQIRECRDEGIEFGSHTLDHADLVAVSSAESRRQVFESKSRLEEIVGKPVYTFCYPYGRKTAETITMVRDAGYRLACSVRGGYNTVETDRYSLNRINLRSDTSLPVLLFKLLRDRRRG
jgi:peptidoglycan/xylan/chitin deacetylase (PgdA/CDA1 family)